MTLTPRSPDTVRRLRTALAGATLALPLLLAAQDRGADQDNDEDTVELPVLYVQTLRQEMLEVGEDWRARDEEEEFAWRREPQYERQGRIVFGYDSIYDETRAREDLFRPANRNPLQQPEPATLFRLRF